MQFKTHTHTRSTYTSFAGVSFTTTEGTTGVELHELDSDSLEEVLTGSWLMGEEAKGEDGVLESTGEVVQLGPERKPKSLQTHYVQVHDINQVTA